MSYTARPVLQIWRKEPTHPMSEFQAVAWAQRITCARCGGRAQEHGRDGECYRLLRRPKRHAQLESLR